MTPRTPLRRLGFGAALGLSVCLAAPALAQVAGAGQTERPTVGLFGSGVGATEQRLVFTGQLGGGADHLWVPEGDVAPARDDRTATFAHWGGRLDYAVARDRVSFNLATTSSGRYFPDFVQPVVHSYGVVGAGQVALSARTSLDGSFRVTERPVSALSLTSGFAGDLLPSDYAAGSIDYRTYIGQVGLSQALSPRSSLQVGYGELRVRTEPKTQDQSSRYGYARYNHALSQSLSLRLGFARTEYVYQRHEDDGMHDPVRILSNSVDAGVDFSRTLSLSRRTTPAFNTGSVYVTDGETDLFSLVGGASLTREIGQSWSASLDYTRSVGFLEVFTGPTLVDTVSVSVGGLLGRRVQFSSSAGASRGSVGFTGGSGSTYESYRGGIGVSTALNRFLGVRADYSYSQYRLGAMAGTTDAFGSSHVRYHSVRVGLDVFAPLWTRARRP